MSVNEKKLAFLSYTREDKDFAGRIANELSGSGIDVWWDEWEIKPGDSLIQKIFQEGLAKCDVFLILLSCASVESKWVKEELDSAMIKRMEGSTRVIPLVKEECRIPLPLRALKWVELSKDFDAGIREIVKSIYDVSEKPPTGKIPDYITELRNSVGGLSKVASTIGLVLLNTRDDQLAFDRTYTPDQMENLVPNLSAEEINDGVEELEEFGLVRITREEGNALFVHVEPTYALFLHFKDEGLDYDPLEDIKAVASTVDARREVKGKDLQCILGPQPLRINRAVAYLEDYGIVRVIRELGRSGFVAVLATRKTRGFVEENCK
jgi:hypothetical protein